MSNGQHADHEWCSTKAELLNQQLQRPMMDSNIERAAALTKAAAKVEMLNQQLRWRAMSSNIEQAAMVVTRIMICNATTMRQVQVQVQMT